MANAFALGEAASRTTVQVDALFLFITLVSLFFFLLVEGLLIYFAIKYRRKKGAGAAETPDIRSHLLLETVWVLIPSLASDDVSHSCFVPAYRIKQDMVPGRYTTLYLHPDKAGTYEILCAEYCGVGHSVMRARLVVMEPGEYAQWRIGEEEGVAGTLAEQGKELVEKSGCLGCHAVEGKEKGGPNFGKPFGRKVLLADGTTVTADEEYLRESIVGPGARVVNGYPNVMP